MALCAVCGHGKKSHGRIQNVPLAPVSVEEGSCAGTKFTQFNEKLRRYPKPDAAKQKAFKEYAVKRMRGVAKHSRQPHGDGGWAGMHGVSVRQAKSAAVDALKEALNCTEDYVYCACKKFVPSASAKAKKA